MKLRKKIAFLLPFLVVIGIVIYTRGINKDFQRLAQIPVHLPVTNDSTFKDVVLLDTSLKHSLTFVSNPKFGSIQSYVYKNKYDVLLFSVSKNVLSKEDTIPLKKTIHIISGEATKDTNNSIYDGSFKNPNVRFFSLYKEIKNYFPLAIKYQGDIVGKPIVRDDLMSYSFDAAQLQAFAPNINSPIFYLSDRNMFFDSRFSAKIIFFRKDGRYFVLLAFPSNNSTVGDDFQLEDHLGL